MRDPDPYDSDYMDHPDDLDDPFQHDHHDHLDHANDPDDLADHHYHGDPAAHAEDLVMLPGHPVQDFSFTVSSGSSVQILYLLS